MRRWTYARTKIHTGEFSNGTLTVFMDGNPIGTVYLSAWAGGQCWHWRVDLTQQQGHCDGRDEALNALRASMLVSLGEG